MAARAAWDPDWRPPRVEAVGPDQESVWDYPRPPSVSQTDRRVRVVRDSTELAASDRALIVRERAGAPVPYLPPQDVRTDWLVPNGRVSICEWKGAAASLDVVDSSRHRIVDAAWTYPDPFDDLTEGYSQIASWIAFHPGKLDCFWGEDRAWPQAGGFYGGWIIDRIRGPIKGGPGTHNW